MKIKRNLTAAQRDVVKQLLARAEPVEIIDPMSHITKRLEDDDPRNGLPLRPEWPYNVISQLWRRLRSR